MSKHRSLDKSLRTRLEGLEGAQRKEALEYLDGVPRESCPLDFWTALVLLTEEERRDVLAILGVESAEDAFASVAGLFAAEVREIERESAGRPGRESLMNTEIFAAVTA